MIESYPEVALCKPPGITPEEWDRAVAAHPAAEAFSGVREGRNPQTGEVIVIGERQEGLARIARMTFWLQHGVARCRTREATRDSLPQGLLDFADTLGAEVRVRPAAPATGVRERPVTKHHPQFDLEPWCGLPGMEAELGDAPTLDASDPREFVLRELRRRKQVEEEAWSEAIPSDVILWCPGRTRGVPGYSTRMGGIPWRPAARPWPANDYGALTFLAQFCFLDSLDLFADPLPGDVLGIYVENEGAPLSCDPEEFYVEWNPAELDDDPLEEVPSEQGFEVPELQGHLLRTYELPSLAFERYLGVARTTRIGGASATAQGDPRPGVPAGGLPVPLRSGRATHRHPPREDPARQGTRPRPCPRSKATAGRRAPARLG